MEDIHPDWEAVIGLEVHVELNTQSKIFSHAPNNFGDEPNTNISPVCTGQPGALPVLNEEAVKKAALFGLAVGADVQTYSTFDRKSYFYPDSPRNFQITQFYHPIVIGGIVTAEVDGKEMSFELDHAHLEDDAGMLKHFNQFAGVDYNRAGVPLLEIVSKPCIHSPKEAVAFCSMIKAIMQYVDASDCNMEEGSLRMDANISTRKKGEKALRNKIEIKNMNSFSNLEIALQAEIKRQIKLYRQNADQDPSTIIQQATYRFDPETKTTILMRSKEEAADYRYFPEPDLPPLLIDSKLIEKWKQQLPELPLERTKRYIDQLGLPKESALVLTSDKQLSNFFEQGLETTPHARSLCNWILVEFLGRFKDSTVPLYESEITPQNIAKLVNFIHKGTITGKIAKKVADDMVSMAGKDCETIIKENPDYQPVSNSDEIEKLVDQVLEENAQSVADFKSGKEKAFGFLVGQVMKLSKGKASPPIVNQLLKDKLS